jgi:hypothetical protein
VRVDDAPENHIRKPAGVAAAPMFSFSAWSSSAASFHLTLSGFTKHRLRVYRLTKYRVDFLCNLKQIKRSFIENC